MAYLKNFKRLIAAKKVLRLFTTKLGLNKLQRSKTKTRRRKIKKHASNTITKGGSSSWLSLSFQSRFKRKRREAHRYPRKKNKPVYVDQLFLDTNKVEMPVVERITENVVASTSGKVSGCVADDMWESLVMGSPQMDGINERAEEFISRFRADLLDQEMSTRRLYR
ncbi:formin-2 like protein [Tanacetum coccineum]|uniref:Formin-2 like protein n=1 Tax=Tanacetum coccineum TaxID=301880 RepID=A0ABQ5ASB6_9ASTR